MAKHQRNPLKSDPTRTTTIRRLLESELKKRFRRIKELVNLLVVGEDAFGLKPSSRNPFVGNEREAVVSLESSGRTISEERIDSHSSSLSFNTRWKFRSDPEKVKAFNAWIKSQTALNITQANIVQTNIDDAYWSKYVEDGYRKGSERAFNDVRKAGIQGDSEFFKGGREEFLRQSFSQPIAIDKVKLLAGRVLTDLQGVTDVMATQMSRVLVDGLTQGLSPRVIARNLNKRVDAIGRTRSIVIARTEIIRAHAEGQLDALEKLGVQEVGVMVEWSTTGDDRVCPQCQPLEGMVITLKEARGIIPRHPQCVSEDTVIQAVDPTHILRTKYTGEIFDFVLPSGRKFTVTSHHILLTQRGWVFAKDVVDSDYLIDTAKIVGPSVPPNYDLADSSIGEIYASLVKSLDKNRVIQSLTMPEDLHGDGRFCDSKIDIVDVDGLLWDHTKPCINDKTVKSLFEFGGVAPIDSLGLISPSQITSVLKSLGNTTDRLISSLGIFDILKARSVTHHQPVGIGVIPDSTPREFKTLSDGSSIEPKLFSKSSNADSIQVEFDDLVCGKFIAIKSVSSRHVNSFPVYDVSTTSSLYSIAGVLTSNCRCAYIPANVGESQKSQIRGKSAIESAKNKSVKAEILKRTKRSLSEQKRISNWPGAKKTISKKRPKPTV